MLEKGVGAVFASVRSVEASLVDQSTDRKQKRTRACIDAKEASLTNPAADGTTVNRATFHFISIHPIHQFELTRVKDYRWDISEREKHTASREAKRVLLTPLSAYRQCTFSVLRERIIISGKLSKPFQCCSNFDSESGMHACEPADEHMVVVLN